MKRQIGKIALGVVSMLGAMAVPGHASTIFNFQYSSGGSVALNGAGQVTSATGIGFSGFNLNVNGVTQSTYTVTGGTLSSADGITWILSGAVSGTGVTNLGTSSTLFTIQFASALTSLSSAFNVGFGGATVSSITENQTLVNDLGLAPTGNVTGLLNNGTGNPPIEPGANGVTSASLNISETAAAVPEPASLLLIGSGLLGLGVMKRRKESRPGA